MSANRLERDINVPLSINVGLNILSCSMGEHLCYMNAKIPDVVATRTGRILLRLNQIITVFEVDLQPVNFSVAMLYLMPSVLIKMHKTLWQAIQSGVHLEPNLIYAIHRV
jgi:hypothetical protein